MRLLLLLLGLLALGGAQVPCAAVAPAVVAATPMPGCPQHRGFDRHHACAASCLGCALPGEGLAVAAAPAPLAGVLPQRSGTARLAGRGPASATPPPRLPG